MRCISFNCQAMFIACSGHQHRLQALRREADGKALVLLDEVGTGTDPAEGAALGVALLRALAAGGARGAAFTMATTHHRCRSSPFTPALIVHLGSVGYTTWQPILSCRHWTCLPDCHHPLRIPPHAAEFSLRAWGTTAHTDAKLCSESRRPATRTRMDEPSVHSLLTPLMRGPKRLL